LLGDVGGIFCGVHQWYPLVNKQFAIENGTFMLIYPLKMVIFHNDVHSPVVVVLVFDTWPRNCNLPSVKNMDVALVLQVQRARD
jgi:hypothetical protein